MQKDDIVTFRVGSKGDSRPHYGGGTCDAFYGGGGGGGASWVYLTRNSADTLLMVAGGGGGGGWHGDKNYCGVGSSTISATSYTNTSGNSDECTDDYANGGSAVTDANFTSITEANGGDGGFHWKTKACGWFWADRCCNGRYACGGGGGGYSNTGVKGPYDIGGGGGGSYLNSSFTSYYSTGSYVPKEGSTGVSSPAAGSISVTNPNCLTCSNCTYGTTYGSCN